jgi:hypothetical protein
MTLAICQGDGAYDELEKQAGRVGAKVAMDDNHFVCIFDPSDQRGYRGLWDLVLSMLDQERQVVSHYDNKFSDIAIFMDPGRTTELTPVLGMDFFDPEVLNIRKNRDRRDVQRDIAEFLINIEVLMRPENSGVPCRLQAFGHPDDIAHGQHIFIQSLQEAEDAIRAQTPHLIESWGGAIYAVQAMQINQSLDAYLDFEASGPDATMSVAARGSVGGQHRGAGGHRSSRSPPREARRFSPSLPEPPRFGSGRQAARGARRSLGSPTRGAMPPGRIERVIGIMKERAMIGAEEALTIPLNRIIRYAIDVAHEMKYINAKGELDSLIKEVKNRHRDAGNNASPFIPDRGHPSTRPGRTGHTSQGAPLRSRSPHSPRGGSSVQTEVFANSTALAQDPSGVGYGSRPGYVRSGGPPRQRTTVNPAAAAAAAAAAKFPHHHERVGESVVDRWQKENMVDLSSEDKEVVDANVGALFAEMQSGTYTAAPFEKRDGGGEGHFYAPETGPADVVRHTAAQPRENVRARRKARKKNGGGALVQPELAGGDELTLPGDRGIIQFGSKVELINPKLIYNPGDEGTVTHWFSDDDVEVAMMIDGAIIQVSGGDIRTTTGSSRSEPTHDTRPRIASSPPPQSRQGAKQPTSILRGTGAAARAAPEQRDRRGAGGGSKQASAKRR